MNAPLCALSPIGLYVIFCFFLGFVSCACAAAAAVAACLPARTVDGSEVCVNYFSLICWWRNSSSVAVGAAVAGWGFLSYRRGYVFVRIFVSISINYPGWKAG